jgi:hypothetical protein
MDGLGVRKEFIEYKTLAECFIEDGDVSGFVEAYDNIRRVLTEFGKKKFGKRFSPSPEYDGFKAVELSSMNDWGSKKISLAALNSLIKEYSPGSLKYERGMEEVRKNFQINQMFEEREWALGFERNLEKVLGRNEVLTKPFEDLSEEEWKFRFDFLLTSFFEKGDLRNTRHPTYLGGIDSCARRGNVSGVKNLARILIEDSYNLRRDHRAFLDYLEKSGLKSSKEYKLVESGVKDLERWIELFEEDGQLLEAFLELARENYRGYSIEDDE